mmetsp:Transcript_39715/g.86475  ORF Transcript_39715/g.86475 Transcript_39715/m.86475 type:complete len:223 (+) Transcript_39715:1359-2027(+)
MVTPSSSSYTKSRTSSKTNMVAGRSWWGACRIHIWSVCVRAVAARRVVLRMTISHVSCWCLGSLFSTPFFSLPTQSIMPTPVGASGLPPKSLRAKTESSSLHMSLRCSLDLVIQSSSTSSAWVSASSIFTSNSCFWPVFTSPSTSPAQLSPNPYRWSSIRSRPSTLKPSFLSTCRRIRSATFAALLTLSFSTAVSFEKSAGRPTVFTQNTAGTMRWTQSGMA